MKIKGPFLLVVVKLVLLKCVEERDLTETQKIILSYGRRLG